MGYQTLCLDVTKQYLIHFLQHKFVQAVQSKDPYFYIPKCGILLYIAQMGMEQKKSLKSLSGTKVEFDTPQPMI